MRRRARTRDDFLIGEEPLEGEAGFFAASADVEVAAAADTVADATLDSPTGFLPPGHAAERGSAIYTPRETTRYLAAAPLLAACGVLAALVGIWMPSDRDEHGGPARPDERPVQVGTLNIPRAHGQGAATRTRSGRSRRPTPGRAAGRRQDSAVSARSEPQHADSPASAPSSSFSVIGAEVTPVPPPAMPTGEFDFER